MSEKVLHRILAAVVFLVSLVVYLMTMAVTVSFWDAGEFIATSYILGIPHSPGTPLYVLVGRVFSMFPLPMTVTQRVNFLSVVFAALGVLMAYLIMVAVIRFMYGSTRGGLGRFIQYAGPFVGALYLTFSSTYWTNAIEAEVYALSAFVMGLCTLLALKWYENPGCKVSEEERGVIVGRVGKKDAKVVIEGIEEENRRHSRNLVYLIIYLISLGIGFHLGTIIVFGGIVLLFLMVRKKAFSNFEFLVFTFGLAVVVADMTIHRYSQLTVWGLVIFAVLVIWSTVSEGKFALAATALFVVGISVHMYLYIRSGLNPAIDEVDPETWRSLYAHLRREQYPPMNVFVRKADFVFQLQHFGRYYREQFRMFGDVMLGSLNLGKAAVAIPTALGLYGVVANFNRERRTWVLVFVSLFLNSLGLIIFLNFSDHEVRERDYFYCGAFYFFSIFIGIGAGSFLAMLAEGVRGRAAGYSRLVVPVGVVLLVCSVLPARYHWFSHDRSRDYIPRDYAYNMLAGLEPDAIIFTNGDNDTFPLWYIKNVEKFRTDVRIVNLSLLRTSWYIKQVRDEEPRVPISLTDEEIERMRPIRLKSGEVAWINDLAVHHIINETNWKRPIYFAVTVPQESWQRYSEHLEMQGMVRKLVPRKGEFLQNNFLMARNFREIFKFRGVLTEDGEVDESVYKTSDTRGMFRNFSGGAFQLGQSSYLEGDYEDAVFWTELSLKLDPTIPYAKRYLGLYYMRNGDPQKAVDHYVKILREEPRNGIYWIMLSSVYEQLGQLPAALYNLQEGSRMAPDERRLFEYGFRIAALLGQRDVAEDFVLRWLEKHPDDKQFRTLHDDMDRFLKEEYGIEPEAGGDEGGGQR